MRDSDIVFRPHRLDRVHHTHTRQGICYLSARRLHVDAMRHPIRVFKSRCVCPGAVAFFLIGRIDIATHNCHEFASNVFGDSEKELEQSGRAHDSEVQGTCRDSVHTSQHETD